MPKVVVSDTSCFIVLTNVGELDLLVKLYGRILTTPDVAKEFGKELPDWVEIIAPIDLQKQKLLEFHIDKGEASAIVLALEQNADLIILDDMKARRSALNLGLEITGTLGIIIKAKQAGMIDSVKPILTTNPNNKFSTFRRIEDRNSQTRGRILKASQSLP
jgi:predicted nucleic acid-binding protein